MSIEKYEPLLSHERLLALLEYDAATGVFRRKVSVSSNAQAGSVAGYNKNNGYREVRLDKKRFHEHRLAWFYVHGKWPTNEEEMTVRDEFEEMTLTDEQCVKFLRRPGSSYDMVRAIYAAGQESIRAKLDEQWNDGFDKGKAAGRKAGLEGAAKVCKPHDDDDSLDAQCKRECAAAIRALSNAD